MLHNLNFSQAISSWTNRFITVGAVFGIANDATAGMDPNTLIGMLHLDKQWSSVVLGIFAVLAIWNRNHPKQGNPAKDPTAY